MLMLGACGDAEVSGQGNTGAKQATGDFKEVAGLQVPDKDYSAVCIIVGNTANEPAPALSSNLYPYFNAAFLTDNSGQKTVDTTKFIIVSAAGTTTHKLISLEGTELRACFTDGNETNNLNYATENYKAINTAFASDPGTSHVDFFEALKEASTQLKGVNGNKLIIVIGSGLNDTGVLNFAADSELLNVDPNVITERILNNPSTNVSGQTLAGCDIVWAGIGSTVLPQPKLPTEGINSVDNLWTIYQSLLTGMGANPLPPDRTPNNSQTSIPTEYKVTPTVFDLQAPLLWSDTSGESGAGKTSIEWHFTDQTLTFLPDSAEFADYQTAKDILSKTADDLNANASVQITILGFQAATSSNVVVQTSELTTARANAVRDLLVNELGVDSTKIVEVRGAGTGLFADEFDDQGVWNTNLAALNRVVVVQASY
jgi:outer membrane protein OmpA-like peptidoglycan-associated protein